MLLSLACVFGGGCGKEIAQTEVIVTVEAEDGIRADINRVNVRLLSAAGGDDERKERFDRDFEAIDWPLSFLVVPLEHDASRTFELIARAYDGKTEIGRVRAVTGFVKEDTRYLTLTFSNSCREQLCDTGQTCKAGECIDADIDVDDLNKQRIEGLSGGVDSGDGDSGDGDSGDGDSGDGDAGDGDSGDGDLGDGGDGDLATTGDGDTTTTGDGDMSATGDGDDTDCTGTWDTGLFGKACWGE